MNFRIYNKRLEKFHGSQEIRNIYFMKGKLSHIRLWGAGELDLFIEDCTIQYFTGILDKNGVEIFEGDIVLYEFVVNGVVEDFVKGEVIFRKCSYQIDGEKFDCKLSYLEDFLTGEDQADLTVVGNIFEKSTTLS